MQLRPRILGRSLARLHVSVSLFERRQSNRGPVSEAEYKIGTTGRLKAKPGRCHLMVSDKSVDLRDHFISDCVHFSILI